MDESRSQPAASVDARACEPDDLLAIDGDEAKLSLVPCSHVEHPRDVEPAS
jgi:hypothetical protein